MLAQQDFDGAARAAQEIVQRRPDSLAAFQILAESSEKQNRPETVAWRAQIARLQPHHASQVMGLVFRQLYGAIDPEIRRVKPMHPLDCRP